MKLTPGRKGETDSGIKAAGEKLIKIKRSSGEYQYVNKEELKALNREKARRRYYEKQGMKKWYRVITAVFLAITVLPGSYFVLQRVKGLHNKRVLDARNTANAIDKNAVGRILVTTNVDGVTVFMDEEAIARTDNKESNLRDIPVGKHTLSVEKPGYIALPISQQVTVVEGEVLYAPFTLRREQGEEPEPTASKKPKRNTTITASKHPEKAIIVLPATPTDVTPPVVNITTGPFVTISDNIGTINNNSISFVLKSSEPAEFSCYLEGYDSDYGEFNSNDVKQYKDLSDGSYIFYVKARDKSGNETPKPLTSNFIVDTNPPGANIVEGPNATVSQQDISFSFSASEPAYFSFYLDGYENAYTGYSRTTNISYSNLPDGNYIFYVKAKDEVGNEDSKPAERSFAVDTTAPGALIVKGPKSAISQDNVTIIFAARKKTSTFAYYLKGRESEFSDYTSKTSVGYNNLSDGTYTFYIKAKDDIGNVDPEPAALSFTVDTTPPKTRITGGPVGNIDYDDVTFTFTASEKTTFSYRLEGYDKGFSAYTSETSKTYNNLPDNAYIFHIKSKDVAKNVEKEPAKRNFTIKTMVVIVKEDFEDKKAVIKAGDFLKSSGVDYWGRSRRRAQNGKFSLWCAGAGGQSGAYDKNMNSWYELQIDLSHYRKASLSFWYYLDTTNDIADQFSVRIAPRDKVRAKDYTGFIRLWKALANKDKTPDWIKQTINLNSFCGKPAVIRFSFDSDDQIEDEGAYIDSIVIVGKY